MRRRGKTWVCSRDSRTRRGTGRMRAPSLPKPDGWALVAGMVVIMAYLVLLTVLLWAAWSGFTTLVGG